MRHFGLLIILILVFWCNTIAQQRFNCTILINGKIPDRGVIDDEFFKLDSIVIPFLYILGEIRIDSANTKSFDNIADDSEISMCFTHLKRNGNRQKYHMDINKNWLFYDYLIIRITTINERKGTYHVGFNTPDFSTKYIKDEYIIRE